MSEYKRLVSYLFAYNNGVKDKNAGFIKVERKNGIIKLWISLKWSLGEPKESVVCFYVRREDMIVGIETGRLSLGKGNIEYKGSCEEDELIVDFDELCGIYIKGNDSLFVSQWEDEFFDVNRIVDYKEYEKRVTLEVIMEQEAEVSDVAETEEEMVTEAELKVITEEEIKADDVEAPQHQLNVWERPIKESIYVQEVQADSEDVEETQGTQQSPWEGLFESRTRVDVFSDDDIYDCVEIAPQDMLMLPGEVSNMMTNSFLNHGFFNFHHLLLGKKYNPESEYGIIIGVPGVYNRREKMTANMFGFEKFKFSMRSDVRMNHFGYWYKEF